MIPDSIGYHVSLDYLLIYLIIAVGIWGASLSFYALYAGKDNNSDDF